jgi:hypothetical protein
MCFSISSKKGRKLLEAGVADRSADIFVAAQPRLLLRPQVGETRKNRGLRENRQVILVHVPTEVYHAVALGSHD